MKRIIIFSVGFAIMLVASSCAPSKQFIEGNSFLLPFNTSVEATLSNRTVFLIKTQFTELLKLDECSYLYTADNGFIYDAFYIHEATRRLSIDEYSTLKHTLSMDYCVLQTNNQDIYVAYPVDTQNDITRFFDDNVFDGCRNFYNFVVFDDGDYIVETWTAFIDDGQGSDSFEFTSFMKNVIAPYISR